MPNVLQKGNFPRLTRLERGVDDAGGAAEGFTVIDMKAVITAGNHIAFRFLVGKN
jgi:hypothetical protein